MGCTDKVTMLRALKKCTRMYSSEYGGCLTPVEIVGLVASGARPNNKSDVNRAYANISIGVCRPMWFYFTPSESHKKCLVEIGK